MSKSKQNLIIVESPAKAKTISRFLGSNYRVESSYGHVRDLPKSKLGIDIEHDFQPSYIIPRKNQKNVTKLKKLTQKSSKLILATDEDREGEAIAWHLKEVLIPKDQEGALPVERIAFHEITQTAIENALKSPRDINLNLVWAQQARRILDRLVGYLLSPFLWEKMFKGLSAGRVQSVALRLIVDREKEREQFKPQEYWTIAADLLSSSQQPFQAELFQINNKLLDKLAISNQNDAQKIVQDLKNASWQIINISEKLVEKSPLPPFITSTLQQEAWKRLNFSAKQTMTLAQKLYEGVDFGEGPIGLITYMRTDSVTLSEEALNKAKEVITQTLSTQYYCRRQFKNKSRLAQEAHEAIRPTNPALSPYQLKGKIDNNLFKLYNLIWQRFIASQMAPLKTKRLIVEVEAKSEANKYLFKSIGSQIVFDGFSKIYPIKLQEIQLPPLKAKEPLQLVKINPTQHFTEPPARYSEATLIKTLEEYGIGRPSTYATIISILKERRYVERDEHKRFMPSDVGLMVDNILRTHFPQIVDIGFTAKIEEELDEIAEGKKTWVTVVKNFYEPFKSNLDQKYGEVAKMNMTEETNEICEKCGAKMVVKYGKYGKFLACSNFPQCRNTKSLNANQNTHQICPKCGQGEIIIKKTKKRGKIFYGCSRWPECDYASWVKPEELKNKTDED